MGLYKLGELDSVIVTMRILHDGEVHFLEAHPSLGYSCSLSELTSDPVIASGHKNGYVFEIRDCVKNSARGPNKAYHLTAPPLHDDMPTFCSDESGVLKADYGGSVDICLKTGQPL